MLLQFSAFWVCAGFCGVERMAPASGGKDETHHTNIPASLLLETHLSDAGNKEKLKGSTNILLDLGSNLGLRANQDVFLLDATLRQGGPAVEDLARAG